MVEDNLRGAKRLKHKVFVDDIVIYTLASLQNKPITTGDMQILFYELKNKHPLCFKSLIFHTNSCSPYSDVLERVLMRGYISGILQYDNTLTNSQSTIIHIERKLTPDQISRLQQMVG